MIVPNAFERRSAYSESGLLSGVSPKDASRPRFDLCVAIVTECDEIPLGFVAALSAGPDMVNM